MDDLLIIFAFCSAIAISMSEYFSITFRTAEDREQHLRELFHTNKQLKQKLKEAFAETTEKLQRELKNVQIENKTIVLENQRLKNKLAKYE